jgi:hypothetical protein
MKIFSRSCNMVLLCATVLVLILLVGLAYGQAGSQHGILVTGTAPTTIGGSGTLAGYNFYRCVGTCTSASSWTLVNPAPVTTPSLLDQSTLVSGTVYSYAIITVDSAGNQSAYSNIATVTDTPITNPNPVTSVTAKNQ